MMILGISGSPKKGRNTEFLLDEALKVASERGFATERLLCSALSVGFCTDCGECSKSRPCPIEDDMAGVLDAMQRADGIIIATPVYFGNVTAQIKAVFDRTIPLRRQGFLLKDKIGGAIAVGGFRNGGQEKTIEAVHSWMHIQGMIVVADGSHFGGIAVRPATEDRMGKNTVLATANRVCDLLERTRRSSCWGGD